MSHTSLIDLPLFKRGQTIYKANDNTLYNTNDGKVYLPPEIFPSKFNLSALRKKNGDDAYVLTEKGDVWATKFWALYPFVRDERDYVGRPMPCDITPDGKLHFVNIMVLLFGGTSTDPFGAAITRDAIKEILKRCKDNSMKCANGTDPTSIDDVYNIIKSLKGKPEPLVFNYIFNWISSLTMESGLPWMKDAISNHLRSSAPFLAIPPEESFPKKTVERHFLVRLADKVGVQHIKEAVKKIQHKFFNKVLKLDTLVHSNAAPGTNAHAKYQALREDPCVDIVEFKDQRYLPKNRLNKDPFYILISPTPNSNLGIVSRHLTQAINAADLSLQELIEMLTSNYHAQNATNSGDDVTDTTNLGTSNDTAADGTSNDTSDVASNEQSSTALHQDYLSSIRPPPLPPALPTVSAAPVPRVPIASPPPLPPALPTVSAAPVPRVPIATATQTSAGATEVPMPSVTAATGTTTGVASDVSQTDDVAVTSGRQDTTDDASLVNDTSHDDEAAAITTGVQDPTDDVSLVNATAHDDEVTAIMTGQDSTNDVPLTTVVTEDQDSVDDSNNVRVYVDKKIYYSCPDTSCEYVSCEPCHNEREKASPSMRGRSRTRQVSGSKRQYPDAQEMECDYNCRRNPFCMTSQSNKDYFTPSQMAKHNRFKCSICGKYFKQTMV